MMRAKLKGNELNYQHREYNTKSENRPKPFGHENKTAVFPTTLYQALPSN
jgi:hypothetical protein